MEEMTPSDPFFYIADVLVNPAATEDDREKYMKFSTFLEDWIILNGNGIFTDSLVRKYKFQDIFKTFLMKEKFEISSQQKDSIELHGYWVIFYRIMRKMIPTAHQNLFKFKYATSDDFLRAYDYCFLDFDETEIIKLFFTANWMSLLFGTVDPRGNKGLAMSVIPKVIEGFNVKYSTGGGQSAQTAARVRIYEHEGCVKPHERPTRRSSISITVPLARGASKKSLLNREAPCLSSSSSSSSEEQRTFKRIFSSSSCTDAATTSASASASSSSVKRMSIGPGTFSSSSAAAAAALSLASFSSIDAFAPRNNFSPLSVLPSPRRADSFSSLKSSGFTSHALPSSSSSFSSSPATAFSPSHLHFFGNTPIQPSSGFP